MSEWRRFNDQFRETEYERNARLRKARLKRAKTLGCDYCRDAGPEKGFIWMDNNGPIVECPVCNKGAQ
jgi:rubrerythrin